MCMNEAGSDTEDGIYGISQRFLTCFIEIDEDRFFSRLMNITMLISYQYFIIHLIEYDVSDDEGVINSGFRKTLGWHFDVIHL